MARQGTLTKVITLPDGSRKWLYAKTEEELNRKYIEAMGMVIRGVKIQDKTTFGEYALMWYKTFKEPFIRTKTKESVLNVLNNHLLPHLSGYLMRDITPVHIQFVFNQMLNLSESLCSKTKSVLTEIFELALDNGVIHRSPVTKSLKVKGKKAEAKDALTPEDAQQLLQALREANGQGAANCLLFCLMALKTGLRRGELCGLMWSDIDFDREELTVTHNCVWPNNTGLEITTNLKTKAAHRTVPIPREAMQALRSAKVGSNSLFVFHRRDGQALTQSAFRKLWEHTKKSQLTAGLTPHILRHTYCTCLFEAGLDLKEIQYLMGHSKPDVTLEIYTHYCKQSRFEDTADRVRAAL